MNRQALFMWTVAVALSGSMVWCAGAAALEPNHPIITEVYSDPPGPTDGPVGRDPTNLHQGFIEVYLPSLSALDTSLLPFKDSIQLTFYEVEGDSTSSGQSLVNYRFDLPAFDLDPSNGTTALPRPASGIVVLGWVDYIGNPPTGFLLPETALIQGGLTSPPNDFTFIAINGLQFGGVATHVSIAGESLIDMPSEAVSGVIQNGSSAYLLVSRNLPGYAELCDDQHALDCVLGADPQLRHPSPVLPGGNILAPSAFLDGMASNDDPLFRIDGQPYDAPTGDDIDLETVLPLGGAYSLLIPQIPEETKAAPNAGAANGYARVYIDVPKTTENASVVDDDPIIDASLAYRHVRNDGPFFPDPGGAPATSSPPQLSVAADVELVADVLAETVGFPGLLSANVGGNFGIDMAVTFAGPSSNGAVATFAVGPAAVNVAGQAFGFPSVQVIPGPSAVHGATATTTVSVVAANTFPPSDPPVDPTPQIRTLTARIVNPTTGLDANGLPFEVTVFAAVQPIPATADANEFLNTDLGAFVSANLGGLAQDTNGNGSVLINPILDLTQGDCIHAGCNCEALGNNCSPPQLITNFPDVPENFLNMPGADGLLGTPDDLLRLVQNAAEQVVHDTYGDNISDTDVGTCAGNGLLCSVLAQNCDDFTACQATFNGVRAIQFMTPTTVTFGGTFSPSEIVHFGDSVGRIDNLRSGFANATTTRTFEMAIVDSNTRPSSTPALPDIESGATDDFGIVFEVRDVEPSPKPPVSTGDFVFLSLSGGLQGADLDGLFVPPTTNVANLILLDLDNLHDVLGIISIESLILMDGGGNAGQADIIEVFSLNPVAVPPVITGWRSCGDHGVTVGEACLAIPDDGSFAESRLSSDRVVVSFNRPIDPATAIASNVAVVGNDVANLPVTLGGVTITAAAEPGNQEMVITFTPPLPDVARYRISLANITGGTGLAIAGDVDRIFTVVRGDSNQSRHVTNADLVFARFFRDLPADPIDPIQQSEVRADVNVNGAVTNADLGAIRFFRDAGSDARAIVDP